MPKAPGSSTFTVARFEFGNYLRTRTFLVSTLVSSLLILVLLNIPSLQTLFLEKMDKPDEKKTLFFVNESGYNIPEDLLAAAVPDLKLSFLPALSLEDETNMLRDNDCAGVFRLHSPDLFSYRLARRPFGQYPEEALADVLTWDLRLARLEEAGLSMEDADALLTPPRILVSEEAELAGKSQKQTQFYTYALILALYITILNYGQLTAVSVASEKSSRAMELLITSTDARSLMNGKILGTGLAGLFQLLCFGLVYLAGYSFRLSGAGKSAEFIDTSLNLPVSTFLLALIVFVLSYLSFAYLYGALGSLVNRSEEVSQVIAPVTSFYMMIFIAGVFATFYPEKLWVAVLSFVPLVGPLLLFVRVSMLDLPLWQILLGLLIHSAAACLIAHLTIRIYRKGVLRYSKPPRFAELFRFMKKEA